MTYSQYCNLEIYIGVRNITHPSLATLVLQVKGELHLSLQHHVVCKLRNPVVKNTNSSHHDEFSAKT